MTDDPSLNFPAEPSRSDFVRAVGSLDETSRKQVIFVFERSIERTIWVWLALTLSASFVRTVPIFRDAKEGALLAGWAIVSAVLMIWAAAPWVRLHRSAVTSLSAEKRSGIYDKACGIKETLKTFLVLAISFVLFTLGIWLFGHVGTH